MGLGIRLFSLIRKKYSDQNFSNINFTSLEGHLVLDPDDDVFDEMEAEIEDANQGLVDDAIVFENLLIINNELFVPLMSSRL